MPLRAFFRTFPDFRAFPLMPGPWTNAMNQSLGRIVNPSVTTGLATYMMAGRLNGAIQVEHGGA